MRNIPLLSVVLLLFSAGCQKKDFDAYYERPDWLANPIYQQLDERGNFTSLLKVIERSGYRNTLAAAGYWTFFAPNDDAFRTYFQKKGISSADEIDSVTARKIVEYALVYNAFKTDHIADFQSSVGWMANSAFRRRTAYYDFVYDGQVNGQSAKLVSANRNGSYVAADNNNKYIPYFFSAYMNAKGVTAADYEYFYPGTPYTGFNVANARVISQDIVAENGVIHEIDQVIEPLASIDDYLASRPEYSEFKKLLDTYKVQYVTNADITERYRTLTGSSEQVYVKLYDASLGFSPNNENFLKVQDNDGQSDCWTLFAPQNDQLKAYINDVLLEHYPVKSIDQLPGTVITDFLNSHFWQTAVWPGKFGTTTNFLAEQARFDAEADIADRQVLSNGFFYGAKKVQEANVFHTVYGRAYLDPAYSLITRALDLERKLYVTNPSLNYALILAPDRVLQEAGFDWNDANSTFQYTAPGGSPVVGADAVNRIKRIINMHIISIPAGGLDLSKEGLAETIGGEIIKFKNNKVASSGTSDNTTAPQQISLTDQKQTRNGTAYYGDGLLTFSDLNIGKHIEKYGSQATDPYYSFYQFLLNATSIYTSSTGLISGATAGNFFTVLIPANAAIQEAVNAGVLPKNSSGGPNYAPTAAAEVVQVSDFIKHHILKNAAIIANGNKEGNFETLLTDSEGYPVTVRVTNQDGNLRFTDKLNNTVSVTGTENSNLSNRTVLHQVNGYLR